MREALRDAMAEEMRREEGVFVMGEDVGVFQGAFKVTEGLLAEFGERRVRDTPISENTIVGMGIGAAMAGLRPVVELMTINFSLLALDQIVNHAAQIHYMFGGHARVPLVVRGPGVAAGTKTEKLTLNTDFAPTFADLAGASFPADGRSLKPLLGDEEPSSWRSSVLLEKLPQEDSSEEGKGKGKAKGKGKQDKTGGVGVPKAEPIGQPAFEAVRTETHKYVEYENGDRELYDLEADPYELESIHESADPSLIESLKAKLDALRSCSEEECQEVENAP